MKYTSCVELREEIQPSLFPEWQNTWESRGRLITPTAKQRQQLQQPFTRVPAGRNVAVCVAGLSGASAVLRKGVWGTASISVTSGGKESEREWKRKRKRERENKRGMADTMTFTAAPGCWPCLWGRGRWRYWHPTRLCWIGQCVWVGTVKCGTCNKNLYFKILVVLNKTIFQDCIDDQSGVDKQMWWEVIVSTVQVRRTTCNESSCFEIRRVLKKTIFQNPRDNQSGSYKYFVPLNLMVQKSCMTTKTNTFS